MHLRSVCTSVALLALLAAVALSVPAQEPAGEPRAAEKKARQGAIAQTIQNLDAELKKYGDGSWEKWGERLKDYRQALQQAGLKQARDGWIFRDTDRRLLALDTLDKQGEGKQPFDAILNCDRQLKSKDIDLIVVVIPDKGSIYPDYIAQGREIPCDGNISVAVKHLMRKLSENDVEVVDLHTPYREFRVKEQDKRFLYYFQKDTHWRNIAMQLAAEKIAERLKRYDFVQQALAKGNPYVTETFQRNDGKGIDEVLLIKTKDGGNYADKGDSPILLTADSYGYYNVHLHSHFTAQVARHVGMPLALFFKLGLWGNMPVDGAREGQFNNRRVVVWTLIARSFLESKWPVVDLPGFAAVAKAPGEEKEVRSLPAKGVVSDLSPGPAKDPPYNEFIMRFHLTGLVDGGGKPLDGGAGVVHVLAMKDKKILPVAATKKGNTLNLRLTSWSLMEKQWGKTMTALLSNPRAEIDLPHYWGEVDGK